MTELDMSIVIPVYQPRSVIFEVLESVQELARKLTVEVIMVYNGPENQIRLADLLLYCKERHVVHSGSLIDFADVSNARNIGLSKAKGQFVKFLDADDVLIVGNVLRQFALMTETHVDVVTGEYLLSDEAREVASRPRRVRTPIQGLISGEIGITSSALFRRSSISHLRWRRGLRINEEKEFYWNCMQNKLKFFHLAEAVFVKTVQPDSLSARANELGLTDITVAKFRIEIWNACRNAISPGELADFRESMLHSFNVLIRLRSIRGAMLAVQMLLSGGVRFTQLSMKQKFGAAVFSPFLFPFVYSLMNGLFTWLKNAKNRV